MSEDNKNLLENEIDNLRDVLDNLQTPFSLSTLESNPRYIYVNDLMLDLLGITRKEFEENEYHATDFYDEEGKLSYKGEVSDNYPNGKGIQYLPTGEKYEGEFNNGRLQSR